jgi:hypothetical protein
MNILFDNRSNPLKSDYIKKCIAGFGESYNATVWEIINNSRKGINKEIFFKNVATLMSNFKMTRAGHFKGVKYLVGRVKDPNGQIAACWEGIGNNTVKLRNFLDLHKKDRARVLIEILRSAQNEVASELWEMFKKLVPLCMEKSTLGLVASSKVLFAVLPEVALPVDNTQWRRVFKTIDYGDIIRLMAEEITEWERRTGKRLDSCDPQPLTTLPAIYNVMAMKTKPQETKRSTPS